MKKTNAVKMLILSIQTFQTKQFSFLIDKASHHSTLEMKYNFKLYLFYLVLKKPICRNLKQPNTFNTMPNN